MNPPPRPSEQLKRDFETWKIAYNMLEGASREQLRILAAALLLQQMKSGK